jgi:NADH-quinone oxidoreductase subunit E
MELLGHYRDYDGGLIPVLQGAQEIYGYLPSEVLEKISQELSIPFSEVFGVVTFYAQFHLKPRGRNIIRVCLGTACHVRGGPKILNEFEKKLNIKAGETTKDNRFTLETVACLGCCAIGPVVVVDGDYYSHTTIGKVASIIKTYAKKRAKK